MNKREVIEKLREHGAWCTDCHDIDGKVDIYVKFAKVRELLEQIDEPQAEKVEVPEFVAEWYEVNKGNLEFNIASAFHRIGRNTHNPQHSIYEWMNDSNNEPMQTLFKMKDGYTVKSKRWVVKFTPLEVGKPRYFVIENEQFDITESLWSYYQADAWEFEDKAKADAMALVLDGSVEEV